MPLSMFVGSATRAAYAKKGLDAHLVSREEMKKTYARDDHEELPKHVSAPVLVVKNDSDDLTRLRGELKSRRKTYTNAQDQLTMVVKE